MMLEKYWARYHELDWKPQLRTFLEKLEPKFDPSRSVLLKSICCWDFLKRRRTTEILSFGYHRI